VSDRQLPVGDRDEVLGPKKGESFSQTLRRIKRELFPPKTEEERRQDADEEAAEDPKKRWLFLQRRPSPEALLDTRFPNTKRQPGEDG
jgi:hypothetical protein